MEIFALIIVTMVSVTTIVGFVLSYLAIKQLQIAQDQSRDKAYSAIKWKLIFAGAIIAFVLSIGSVIYNIYFIANSQTAIAKVVKVTESREEDGSIFYYPVYEYEVGAGIKYQGKSEVGDDSGFLIGQTITVRYLNDSPSKSRVDDFANIWALSMLFGIISLFLFVWGFLLKYYYDKKGL